MSLFSDKLEELTIRCVKVEGDDKCLFDENFVTLLEKVRLADIQPDSEYFGELLTSGELEMICEDLLEEFKNDELRALVGFKIGLLRTTWDRMRCRRNFRENSVSDERVSAVDERTSSLLGPLYEEASRYYNIPKELIGLETLVAGMKSKYFSPGTSLQEALSDSSIQALLEICELDATDFIDLSKLEECINGVLFGTAQVKVSTQS